MAANYWDSTQAKFWTFSKAELAEVRSELHKANQALHAKYALPDRRLMSIYFQQQLTKLARRMNVRQQALATAQMYVKRFYLRVELRKTNPYLIMATAVYLACKMDECPQHIRLMLGEAARQWPELGVSESSKIGECEFALISTLSSRLICHHPYRTLNDLAPQFRLTTDETQLAHSIINDSYNTDLAFLYPPHVLAVVAIFLAVVLRPSGQPPGLQAHSTHSLPAHAPPPLMSPISAAAPPSLSPAMSSSAARDAFLGGFSGLKQAGPKLSKLVDWLAESSIDMHAVVDATQELVSLYQVWEESYNERACKESITKFLKDAGIAGGSGAQSHRTPTRTAPALVSSYVLSMGSSGASIPDDARVSRALKRCCLSDGSYRHMRYDTISAQKSKQRIWVPWHQPRLLIACEPHIQDGHKSRHNACFCYAKEKTDHEQGSKALAWNMQEQYATPDNQFDGEPSWWDVRPCIHEGS
ncbi:hypothetical protein AC579_6304 [Pseudocercospora musae]|uniref:RNA polymerase II holoenzyme cyclin-like subunit n=1 Tax=Pseudocercospora musae TaxID=113226 RepID=A0A139IP83_9PEZI|nr:hypothetical protein AC579_6304 [Pseudocercospora musae]